MDDAGVLGERDEFVRADRAEHRVMPAHQHFDLLDPIAAQTDLGLEAQGEFVAADGLTQIAGEAQTPQMLFVLAQAIDAGTDGACGADLAPRDIGAAQ